MKRLTAARLAEYLDRFPPAVRDLVEELRALVLRAAPAVQEAIRFRALCYFKSDYPFGAIGGNVCLVSPGHTCVRLEFIHGAFLADPQRLLRGAAKAKRFIEVCSRRDIRARPFRALIRAALAYSPAGPDWEQPKRRSDAPPSPARGRKQ